ncbi:hypothetical protein [Actinomadura sp. 21ATH]|uniref:hypothetical protein n=1 Tax=Actinomadura sp. 21ATH TaxID=1735444 RepID=UPI0035C09D0E
MTLTAAAVKDPRELIPDWAFSLLVYDFRKKHHTSHAYPEHLDLFSKVFAAKWRDHSQANAAGWVHLHADLTGRWAEYRLGARP